MSKRLAPHKLTNLEKKCAAIARHRIFNEFNRQWYLDKDISSESQLFNLLKIIYRVDGRSDREIYLRMRDAYLRYVECVFPDTLKGIPTLRNTREGKNLTLSDSLELIYRLANGEVCFVGRGEIPSALELISYEIMAHAWTVK